MYELKTGEYDALRPLFQALDYHLAVNGILEGSVPARLFVDYPSRPQASFTWAKQRLFLVGSPDNDEFNKAIRRLITETIYPQAREAGEVMFVLYYDPDRWEDKIPEILKDKHPIKTQRQYYTFKKLNYDWRTLLPEGFTVHLVDEALLEDKHLKNLDDLTEEMCSERPSVQDFLDRSFGVCVLHGDEIVGWCLSEYNWANRCEVGIETVRPYQKRGLGTLMASAMIEYALSKGINQIGWHCYANNQASVATALKIGFEKARDYPVYFAWFNEIDNLAVNGNVCLEERRYREAMEWFKKAIATGDAKDWAYWGAACASACLGQRKAAFGYLNQAIEKGFTHPEYIKSAEPLKSLHGAEEWESIIRKLE